LGKIDNIEHWAVHEGGFRVDGRPPQGFSFLRPDGSVLPVSSPRRPINGQAGESLKEANRRAGLDIWSQTVDSFWDGEALDYHMAVDALLSYDDASADQESPGKRHRPL